LPRARSPAHVGRRDGIGHNQDAEAPSTAGTLATETPDPAARAEARPRRGALRAMGLGLITGAAYDLAQTVGWTYGLHTKPRQAKKFYAAITAFTFVGMAINFIGLNPMHFLVWSGVVQGFSTPPLMLLIILMTNNRRVMGERVNGRAINILGWATTAAIFAATLGLVVTWIV
jgi:Mn2+/Fe2+ NRAMP family transporter